jgi:phenylacetate-CoA ligase
MAAGGEWLRCLREIENSSPDQIQARYAEALLRHATTHVPYYQGLGLEGRSLDAVPILTRHTLRERFSDLQSRDLRPSACSKTYTGGSTGEPVWVLQDGGFRHWFNATDMYYLAELVGIPCAEYLSHPRVAVWHQRPPDRASLSARRLIARLLDQVIHLETNVGMGDDILLSYVREINRAQPLVIVGTSSYLYELARLAKRKNLRVHHPRVILASAEMLYPQMRELLQEVFGCPVRERYGAVEAGRVAGECQRGNLHVFSFACRVEVLDPENRPTPPGEEGRIIVTPLHNLAMPLIRYDIGDMALRPTAECSCGSSLPILGTIRGRVAEHFVTADGRAVFAGYFVAMFYDHPWISEFQVLQEDLDRVRVFYRTMPGDAARPQAIADLTRVIREAMGETCRVSWEEVDEVPRTPLGKHLHIRSLVWQERVKDQS